MKKILAAAALVAFVASPAVAQTYMQPAPGSQARMYVQPQPQYGTPFDYERQGMQNAYDPTAVYSADGRFVGKDPDPFIRNSLERDADALVGSGS